MTKEFGQCPARRDRDNANQRVEGWRKDPNLGFSPPLTSHIDPMLLPLRHAFETGNEIVRLFRSSPDGQTRA